MYFHNEQQQLIALPATYRWQLDLRIHRIRATVLLFATLLLCFPPYLICRFRGHSGQNAVSVGF